MQGLEGEPFSRTYQKMIRSVLYKDNSSNSVLDGLQIVKFDNFQMQSGVNTCFEKYSGHLGT